MRTHKNRVPTRPNRKKITPENGAAYYAVVERADEPTEEGTVVNKEMLDEFLAASGTTAGSGTAFTLAQDGFSLFDGALVRVKLNRDMVAGATLNVNSTGAKAIVDAAGNAITTGAKSGYWLDLIYNSGAGRYVIVGGDNTGRAKYEANTAVTTHNNSSSAHTALFEAAKPVAGIYTGNGGLSQTINLGFTPSAVLVEHPHGYRVSAGVSNPQGISTGGLAINGYPATEIGARVIEVVSNGFTIRANGTNDHNLNVNGQKNYYVAFK